VCDVVCDVMLPKMVACMLLMLQYRIFFAVELLLWIFIPFNATAQSNEKIEAK